ncbi:MAG: ABC transporter permease [Firmicutes bacterium]|nr:ABC transporter permease [Bacillota bacterium]
MGNIIMNLIVAAVLAGTPLLFGTLGEILTEKSGNLNLGVEGMMFMGSIAGLAGAMKYEAVAANPSGSVAVLVAIICAFGCGVLGALIYSIITVTLRANQNVTGLALTIFGTGFANFFGEVLGNNAGGYAAVGDVVKAGFSNVNIPVLSSIPVIGRLVFSYNSLVYVGIITAIIIAVILNKTRIGLNLRAVGENPSTADAAGINVTKYKYLATCIGGGICGIGGMYVSMVTCSGIWVHNCVSGKGWIAVALVIFAIWRPKRALLGGLIFGLLSIMRLYIPLKIPMQIYDIFPYIATIIVLIAISLRRKRENQPPASLGLAYFREER